MPDPADIEALLRQLGPAPAPPLRHARRIPMDRPGRFPWRAAASLLLAAGLVFWITQPGKEAARVLAAKGMALKPGDTLPPGAALSLPLAASLSLALPDGSRLDLSGGARGTLGPGRGRGEILSLEEGHLRCEVAHGTGEFLVHTPRGEVLDRGTVFTVDIRNPGNPKEDVMKHGKTLGAVVTVAVISGWIEFRQPSGAAEPPIPVKAGESLTARPGEAPVVSFPAPASVADTTPPGPVAVPPPGAPLDPAVEPLLARVQAALQAKDFQAFSDALLALLDAGEPAYPALIGLMREVDTSDDSWLMKIEHEDLMERFGIAVMLRIPKLGGLVDAILSREGEPDKATGYAFDLLKIGARSRLPRETQSALLLGMLRKAAASGTGESHEFMTEAAQALLVNLKLKEALPEIEKMILEDASDRNRDCLLDGIAGMDAPEAAASLRRILGRMEDAQERTRIIDTLGQIQGKDANALLWELSGTETDEMSRYLLMTSLACRGENADRILQLLRSPQLGEKDRQTLLGGLSHGGGKKQQQVLWDLYDESEPAMRDGLLMMLLHCKDPKATGILVQRLRSGQISEPLATRLEHLDIRTLRENADAMKTLAADTATPVTGRIPAFRSLLRVDRQGAVDAIMTGFPQLPEGDRVKVIRALGGTDMRADGGSTVRQGVETEGKDILERLATSDPSQEVREAARYYICQGLVHEARTGGEKQKQAFWSRYESEPAMQDELLLGMLRYRINNPDPKATGILVQRLQSGRITERIAPGLVWNLDTKTRLENAGALRALAADTATPLTVRENAFWSLSKVDRRGALDAIMTGFPQLPESDRVKMIDILDRPNKVAEDMAILEGIAASDPSQKVRDAARESLKR